MLVNFPEIKNDEFPLIPEGEYIVTVKGCDATTSKAGNEMWVLTLKIMDGEYEGKLLQDRLVYTEKALWKWKMICSKLGMDVSKEVDLQPVDFMAKVVRVTVSHENGDPKWIDGKEEIPIYTRITGWEVFEG